VTGIGKCLTASERGSELERFHGTSRSCQEVWKKSEAATSPRLLYQSLATALYSGSAFCANLCAKSSGFGRGARPLRASASARRWVRLRSAALMHLRYAHRYSLHCPIAISANPKPTRVTRLVGAIIARIPNPTHPTLAHVLSAGSLYRVRRFGGDAPAFTVCAEIGFRYDNVRLGDTISFASCC